MTQEITIDGDKLTVMPLGAGQEVGRSCIIIKYHGHRVMLDCGIHPAYDNIGGLPFLDAINPGKIDVLLVSHFHIDHIAGVPWFLTQTSFNGPCYMTHATKAISKTLLVDYVGVSGRGNDQPSLFTKMDVTNSQSRITAVNYHQTVTHGSIRMICYPAGHVLGACMWLVEIDGVKVLYTGDFSLEDERHLSGAEIPRNIHGELITPDVLLIESTHGIGRLETREEREFRFIDSVKKIIKRGGRCLIPIFALGRAQELLLILDEYWDHSPELSRVPIYYGSNLARKSIDVYNTYYQSHKVVSGKGKFDLSHVKYIRNSDEIDDTLPCVVLCAPAMLQNGMSRTIFERWCPNPLNGMIIPGYIVDNTLPQKLLKNPAEIETLSGTVIPRKISFDYVSFSGHSDFTQTSKFITELKPKKIVLIHGVQQQMMALKEKLQYMFREEGIQVHTPAVCTKAVMYFQSNPTAIITGSLSEKNDHLSGIIVRQNGQHYIMKPSDLSTHSNLKTFNTSMNQEVTIDGQLSDYEELLSRHFAGLEKISNRLFLIGRFLRLEVTTNDTVNIKWESDPTTDMIADNVALILSSGKPSRILPAPDELFTSKLQDALRSRWGDHITFDNDNQMFYFEIQGVSVLIPIDPDSPNGISVECESETLTNEIKQLASRIHDVSWPIVL